MSNLIIIFFELIKECEIILYDISSKKIGNIKIRNKNFFKTRILNCYKIKKNKILVSTSSYGFIINLKTKQLETICSYLNNINSLIKVKKYTLGAINHSKISQFNERTWEILNNYFLCNSLLQKGVDYIIDAGNNFICTNILFGLIHILIKYK